MPGFDQTGPQGQGPRTGRGLGSCGGGIGRGFGCGYGRRFRSPKNELVVLEDEEKMLSDELEAVREEIKALKGE